jgi:hypothetical protein
MLAYRDVGPTDNVLLTEGSFQMKKVLAATAGAVAIALLAIFAVTAAVSGSVATHTTADSGQESKFPTPTPPSPAAVSGAVTTTAAAIH